MSTSNLAIFDLDYTITKRGTWGRFVWMCVKRRPHVWLPLLLSAGWTQWRYKQGHLPRIRVKQAMMRWAMAGWPKEKLMAMGEAFAEREVRGGLKPGAIKALAKHREAGDEIFIASAAVDILVAPIARRLNVTHYVATDMAWDEQQRLAPGFASENCYGEEKLRRIMAVIDGSPDLQHKVPVISYSDSAADLPLLQYTQAGVAVDPKPKFEAISRTIPSLRVEKWV